jgi:NADPH:quinone reductase-like Zn-dependent oxidoreductase
MSASSPSLTASTVPAAPTPVHTGHGYITITGPRQAAFTPLTINHDPIPADDIAGPAVASAISPGTEIGSAFAGHRPERLPCSVGYAMVFRVERAGATSGFAVGDLAFCFSNHRSWVQMKGADAWPVPAGLDPADAALARLAAVSWSTLVTTGARPPERVAVCGLGIVGHFAAQIFNAAGYQVVACDPVASRRELLAGLDITCCERLPLSDSTWQDQVTQVVECSGHEASILDACKLVRKGGEVALVGVPWVKRTDLSAHDILTTVFHRYVHLRTGWEWEVPRQPADFRHGSIRSNISGALDWLAKGRLRTTGLYRRVDPRQPQTVYDDLLAQRGGLTAVFDWTLL